MIIHWWQAGAWLPACQPCRIERATHPPVADSSATRDAQGAFFINCILGEHIAIQSLRKNIPAQAMHTHMHTHAWMEDGECATAMNNSSHHAGKWVLLCSTSMGVFVCQAPSQSPRIRRVGATSVRGMCYHHRTAVHSTTKIQRQCHKHQRV